MFTLAIPQYVVGLLVVLFVVISVMMMLIVLIQRPQGGGLSEAFGASSGSNTTAFGAKTGDALTTATIIIFLLFIGFAIGLNYMVRPPRELPAQEAQATGAEGQPEGVTARTVDPETGQPGAPIQLERLPGPPPGAPTEPPTGAGATGSATSTFTVPPEPQAQPSEPAPTEPASTEPAKQGEPKPQE